MEVSVNCPKPASQELSSNCASKTTPNIPTHYSSGDLCMDDLKMCLNEFSSIEDIGISTVGKNNNGDVIEDECKDLDEPIDNLPASTSSVEELLFGGKEREDYKTSEINDCQKSTEQSYSPPKSLSTPLKLVSAMKGNREKKRIWGEAEKLSVTWAPDVYDPIPTSVSHYPSSKNQQCRNNGRKYGKNKQRGGGKSSRGGGNGKGKEKKQTKKNGGNTTKPKAVQDDCVSSFSEHEAGIINYNVVGADPFCGSSFLKESFNNMHFPVAEATH